MDMVEQGSANEQTDEIIRGVRHGEEAAEMRLLLIACVFEAAAARATRNSETDPEEKSYNSGMAVAWTRAAGYCERSLARLEAAGAT